MIYQRSTNQRCLGSTEQRSYPCSEAAATKLPYIATKFVHVACRDECSCQSAASTRCWPRPFAHRARASASVLCLARNKGCQTVGTHLKSTRSRRNSRSRCLVDLHIASSGSTQRNCQRETCYRRGVTVSDCQTISLDRSTPIGGGGSTWWFYRPCLGVIPPRSTNNRVLPIDGRSNIICSKWAVDCYLKHYLATS